MKQVSTELEQARRELETRKLVANFERLVRAETVEACARKWCHYCGIGNSAYRRPGNCDSHEWQHTVNGEEVCCYASNVRALAPVVEDNHE